ncbi:MAG: hypothetical protein ACRCWM_06480 [Sarcina sp.]
MGIKSFSRQMFSKTVKDSFSYIFAVAITAMLVFATVNISFNEDIYNNVEGQTVIISKMMKPNAEILDKSVLVDYDGEQIELLDGETLEYELRKRSKVPKLTRVEVKISDIQKEIIMITILIVAIFTVISNSSFLKKRMDELGFILVNGATKEEMSYYIRYMCSKMFIVASGFGLILGVCFAPVFNLIMYKLLGIQGGLFVYTKETFLVVISFIFINYVYLMIASTSYVFKKEIDEIMSDNNAKSAFDKRLVKFPTILYLIMFFSPFATLLLPKKVGDISGFITIGVYIMSLASIGVITLYLPQKLIKINKKKFMYDKQRKIYINNAFIKLRNTIVYICGMVIATNYFIDKILEFREHQSIVAMLLFAMVVCVVIITVTLTNKIIDDCGIDKEFYKNLSAIGYSKKDLFKISLKENRLTIIGILFFVILPISFAMLMHLKNKSLPINMLLLLSAGIIIPILIGGLISYRTNKENLYSILEMDSKGLMIMKKTLEVFSKALEKLLISAFSVSDDTENLWKRKLFWKIKMPHLVGTGFIILMIPIFLMGVISSSFKKSLVDLPVVGEGTESKMDGLLNLYLGMPKLNNENGKAYYYKAIAEYNYMNGFVYYTGEGKYREALKADLNSVDEKIKLAIESHKLGMESSEVGSNYYMKNALALISLYFNSDNLDEAFAVAQRLKNSQDEKVASYGLLSEGLLNLKLNEFDKGIELLEKINEKYILDKFKYVGEAYKMKGDFKKAAEWKTKEPQSVNQAYAFEVRANSNNYGVHDVEFTFIDEVTLAVHEEYKQPNGAEAAAYKSSEMVDMNNKVRENYLKNILSEEYRGSIKGKFDIAGIDLSGIAIELTPNKRLHDQLAGIYRTYLNTDMYTAYVQKDGSFEFNNIVEGDYFINLVIPQNKFGNLKLTKDTFINEIIRLEAKEEKELIIESKDGSLMTNEEKVSNRDNNKKLKGSYKQDGNKLIFEIGKGEDVLPDEVVAEMDINKEAKEVIFYKLFTDERIKGLNDAYGMLGMPMLGEEGVYAREAYDTSVFNGILEQEEIMIKFPKEIQSSINVFDFANVKKICHELYEEDSTNEDALSLLIKIYVTGVDNTGAEKDINKALELSDKLYEIHKDKFLDQQVKNFIYKNRYLICT